MTDTPQGALELLAGHARSGFPHLRAARARTDRDLETMRASLRDVPRDPDASIVLMGSWGRRERTSGSDDDFLVLVGGDPRPDARPALERLGDVIGAGEAKPGTQGVFGQQVFVGPMVGNIGLEDDSNANLTQRMLLALESVPVVGREAYRGALERVVDGYLAGQAKDYRPPRFLLNDLIRYWRTICVDFAGKARAEEAKWGMRNAKLRLNRKMLFAGGLIPVLLCQLHRREEQRPFLLDALQAPPTDRLADAFLRYEAVDEGVRALGAYDRWIGMLDDGDVRARLTAMTRAQAAEDRLFREVRGLAKEFEQGLLALLFETRLSPLAREFVVF
ncbi:hypothetical protein [Patulibacter sp. SYSU D01012]|uniref:hypothetical protein n=1 Tax=Patulibacter sp. SYSU D01012 TaxID=2817381 RepID=UPI001B311827|nr:hypothetical protein [Patulibacter sp. SYSU D01012]